MLARSTGGVALAVAGAALVRVAAAQEPESQAVWHNRYHALLAMATYADDGMQQCAETFTEASMRQNFPSKLSALTVSYASHY